MNKYGLDTTSDYGIDYRYFHCILDQDLCCRAVDEEGYTGSPDAHNAMLHQELPPGDYDDLGTLRDVPPSERY